MNLFQINGHQQIAFLHPSPQLEFHEQDTECCMAKSRSNSASPVERKNQNPTVAVHMLYCSSLCLKLLISPSIGAYSFPSSGSTPQHGSKTPEEKTPSGILSIVTNIPFAGAPSVDYLPKHIRYMEQAVSEDGVDLTGYTMWAQTSTCSCTATGCGTSPCSAA